jgi:hypothetical protein
MSHYTSVPISELTPAERQEMIERSARRRQFEDGDKSRPMSPDQDLTWENTNFKDYDND